jgi:hypothetical protein
MADRVTNPLVEQFRRGGVARDLRLMAAQGLLPLKPEDLLELWTDLCRDGDAAVRAAAEQSLAEFPAAEFLPVLKNRDTSPSVLSWVVTHRADRELREVSLQNTSLPDEAIEALAPTLSEALAELVVINQTRLLRSNSLLVALEANPSLNSDQRRRLRELRETFRIGEAAAEPVAAPPPAPVVAPPPAAAPAAEPEAEAAAPAEAILSEDEALVRYLSEEERQQTEKVSAVQKIYRLNTAEKVITALKGSREERAILIRDPNRIVSAAVLGSPKVTDAEIDAFSAMKNISDVVLRAIGNDKDHVKRYSVINNLVHNPRTPIGIALTLLPRLNSKDLKGIAVDRNVPEPVRKHAQKFIKGPQVQR